MPSPIVTATIQAAVLSATSNVLAQVISAYRKDVGFSYPCVDVGAMTDGTNLAIDTIEHQRGANHTLRDFYPFELSAEFLVARVP